MRFDNPLLVRWEYASEERLAKRNEIFRNVIEGPNPEEVAFEAVAAAKPRRVLDVGCGPGELTERFAKEVGADVRAIDISPRMVELTRARGIDARIADVENLPFGDGEFDCVFAGWVLYHVPDVQKAIAECARVLKPGGRLVASSFCDDNIMELWELIPGALPREALSFTSTNGADLLRAQFASVEQRDVRATLVFPDTDSMRTFVASTIDRAHLAPEVPETEGPFRATTRHVVFVAEKAG
jgi:ubiquinone/menaquinone biosynthesis C-methylase UbiE